MEILKKFKFGHFIIILILCLGTSIGFKVKKIYDVLYPSSETKEILVDSFDLDGKVFDFYQNNNSAVLEMKLNGVNFNYEHGYYNDDQTRHIYIDEDIYPTYFYQNGELLKPIKIIEDRNFYRINIYEFDINSEIKMIKKTKTSNTSTSNDINNDLDYDKLNSLVSTWKKLGEDEDIKPHYKNINMFVISDYDFNYGEFYKNNSKSFSLMRNSRIIIQTNYIESNKCFYELTQEQYDEFIDFINNFNPQ